MISFLTGRVAGRGDGFALLDVSGVGLKLLMTSGALAALPAVGDVVTVQTHLQVREDDLTLYGFRDAGERHAFEALLTVSGVGPKVALATLSALSADELTTAVATEDVALVSSVPGVGRKTAQRIIVDLADKLGPGSGIQTGSTPGAVRGDALSEAREALKAMGFTPAEIAVALKGAQADQDTQALLRFALARLGRSS